MADILQAKHDLLEFVNGLNHKYELSKTVGEDYYEPGMMENLEQYRGEYVEQVNMIFLRVESKGLRYDNQTQNLERIAVGDEVRIVRDNDNPFNSNNFAIKSIKNEALGNLPAELCNALAPLYDAGYATILTATVSYIERLKDRSRYAKQGVMFVELNIKMRCI